MALTPQQLADRKNAIGSSDMAAILGLCKSGKGRDYATAWDVWAEKTGKLKPNLFESNEADEDEAAADDGDNGSQTESAQLNLAIIIGNALEPVVLNLAERRLGKIERSPATIHRPELYMAANLDGRLVKDGSPVEAKTAGAMTIIDKEEWGPAWTDQVPRRYIIQTHHQMIVTDTEVAYIPGILFGRGFQIFMVRRDKDVSEAIIGMAKVFWENHVLKDIPPDDSLPTLDVIKRYKRTPSKVISIPEGPIGRYLDAKEQERRATAFADEAKRIVASLALDAERVVSTDGLLNIATTKKKLFNKDLVAKDYPDIVADDRYYKTSEYPIFRKSK